MFQLEITTTIIREDKDHLTPKEYNKLRVKKLFKVGAERCPLFCGVNSVLRIFTLTNRFTLDCLIVRLFGNYNLEGIDKETIIKRLR